MGEEVGGGGGNKMLGADPLKLFELCLNQFECTASLGAEGFVIRSEGRHIRLRKTAGLDFPSLPR